MNTQIRPAEETDLPAVLSIYNDAVRRTTAVFEYEPRDPEAHREWFAAKRRQGWPVLVAVAAPAGPTGPGTETGSGEESGGSPGERAGGPVVGFASYGPFRAWPAYRHTVEQSVYVTADWRGRGVGSRLVAALVSQAQAEGYHVVVAGVEASNAASLRLHERAGFERVAHFRQVGWKFDRWLDLVFLQRVLGSGPGGR